MVDIKKDSRKWKVVAELPNDECPYLFYPINVHGCEYKNREDYELCNMDNCPIIKAEKKASDVKESGDEDKV